MLCSKALSESVLKDSEQIYLYETNNKLTEITRGSLDKTQPYHKWILYNEPPIKLSNEYHRDIYLNIIIVIIILIGKNCN